MSAYETEVRRRLAIFKPQIPPAPTPIPVFVLDPGPGHPPVSRRMLQRLRNAPCRGHWYVCALCADAIWRLLYPDEPWPGPATRLP